MKKLWLFAMLFTIGCGGQLTVPAGGEEEGETVTLECKVEEGNFVCPVPEEGVTVTFFQGPQGEQGLQGEKGNKGDAGSQGLQGAPGEQGPVGLTGAKGDTGLTGPQGAKGDKGEPGDDAQSPFLSVDKLSHKGQCLFVGDDIWVEHEGGHVDVYNNDKCDHDPAPKKAYCDDINEGDLCLAGSSLIRVDKQGYKWHVYKETFAPHLVHDGR